MKEQILVTGGTGYIGSHTCLLYTSTGVTAISVALLAYVNELTKEPIAQANAKTLSDAVSAVVLPSSKRWAKASS